MAKSKAQIHQTKGDNLHVTKTLVKGALVTRYIENLK